MRRAGRIWRIHSAFAGFVCWNSSKIFTLAESLGGVESLLEVQLTMTHGSVKGAPFAPPAGLVCLSVGIETLDDLIADLAQGIG